MKTMKILVVAVIAIMCQQAQAADNCMMVADGFLEAADAGRRGVPVSELTARIQKIADSRPDLPEHVMAAVRVEFLEAYQLGASGETMGNVWSRYYAVCKRDEAKKPEREL